MASPATPLVAAEVYRDVIDHALTCCLETNLRFHQYSSADADKRFKED
jgi:hypothetical protein